MDAHWHCAHSPQRTTESTNPTPSIRICDKRLFYACSLCCGRLLNIRRHLVISHESVQSRCGFSDEPLGVIGSRENPSLQGMWNHIAKDLWDQHNWVDPQTFFSLYFPFYIEQYLNKGTLIALYFEIFGQHMGKTRTSLFALSTFCIIGFTTTVLMNLFYCRFGCYWYARSPSLKDAWGSW
jgi:hypothetical protein